MPKKHIKKEDIVYHHYVTTVLLNQVFKHFTKQELTIALHVDEGPTLEFHIKYMPNEAELRVHILRCTVSILIVV